MTSYPRRSLSVLGLLAALLLVASGDEPSRKSPSTGDATRRVDYHAVRGRRAKASASQKFEGELHLTRHGKSRVQGMRNYGAGWSGDAHLLWDGVVGESMRTEFRLVQAGRYRLSLKMTNAPDYGVFRILLNGKEVRKSLDFFAPRVRLSPRLDMGEFRLKPGPQKLEFVLTGGNQRAKKYRGKGYLMGLDYVQLVRLDPVPSTTSSKKRVDRAQVFVPRVSTAQFSEMRPLLKQHCYGCHSGARPKGDLDLKRLTSKSKFMTNIEITRKVVSVLEDREMPPKSARQLDPKDRAGLTGFFQAVIDEYLRSSHALAPVVMRRMNRYEYNNAVRDLLGLRGDIYPLPEKVIRSGESYFDPASGRFPEAIALGNRALGKNQIEQRLLTGVTPFAIDLQAEHGFNNRGTELSVSPILLESFLKLGKAIVDSPEFDSYCRTTDSFFRPPRDISGKALGQLAEKRLRELLTRAFRRAVDDSTVTRYVGYFRRELERTKSFSRSMKNVVAAILASPRFLYLSEHAAPAGSRGKGDMSRRVSGYELASRLSFFLWSSIPDRQLLQLAASGRLLEPPVLQRQVRRMLEDRRSQALSQNFARQWLRLDQLITAVPDFDRFQVYYSRIGCEQWKFGLQMMLEPLLLFESIMVEDRSIMLLVDSNYAYRSDELQSWYNEKQPFKGRQNRNRFNTNRQVFRRRKLETRRQGGVMTSAAVLTMTSAPLRTSPITRGAWVATVIFNRPPPPPPDVVPPIEADDAAFEAKGLTLRQRLKQHQVNESCRSCHSKIDPLGFALENFDAIGRWRDKYRSGLPIDATGRLYGKATFSDVVGLKNAILEHPEWFMRSFAEHMLSYALGRPLRVGDRPAVDRILRRAITGRGQFSTIVVEVATSYPFLHKTDQKKAEPNQKRQRKDKNKSPGRSK